jgi:hypothetical protein
MVLEELLVNLLAQAVWELGLSPIFRGSEATPIEDDEESVARIQTTRYAEIARVAAHRVEDIDGGPVDLEIYRPFFESAAVKNLVRGLYVFKMDSEPSGYIEESQGEFLALWERSPLSDLGRDAGVVAFQALLKATEEALSLAISEGILSAHEARSNARHRVLEQRLGAIERQVRLLGKGSKLDLSAADAFELAYRQEVHRRHAYITPPDFYSASRVEIDRLYVMPRLVRAGRQETAFPKSLSVDRWLSSFQNAVVLGDPGGGKSTLAAKLCHVLSSDAVSTVINGTKRTPVMVTLREYNAVRKDQGLSIVGYIEHIAETRYQLEVPEGAVDFLLLSGRLVVIFDGLDELLETHHRQQIRDDVESFQRRYPDAPILVTSRSVGYEQAPLSEDVFETASLAQFSDEQVAEYAYKWFSFDEDLTAKEQNAKAEAFIEESRSVPDLRVNPLMLALMCNFYRGQNYLPRHRPEVYEQCARMLFETWDRSRGIEQVLPIAEHIRPAMRHLAYWIYQDEDRQSGVPEDALVEKAVEFLMKYRFDDEHEARHAAQAFIEFCAGRAWVFTDTGTASDGEPLFQFTHRTFLEYFTADHLVGVADSTQHLSNVLRSRIASREWVVVAQVAYQLRARGNLSAADELLEDLVRYANEGSPDERVNVLLFVSECLAFLVPSPPVVRLVSESVLEFVLDNFAPGGNEEKISVASQVFPMLLTANVETRRTVGEVVEARLLKGVESDGPIAFSAAEAIQGLQMGQHLSPELMVDWSMISETLRVESHEKRIALAREDEKLARSMAYQGDLGIAKVVAYHGSNSLFTGWSAPLEPHAFYGPLSDAILTFASAAQVGDLRHKGLTMLEEVGASVPVAPLPWSDLDLGTRFGFQNYFGRSGTANDQMFTPMALGGIGTILAVKLEEQMLEGDREGAGPDVERLGELIQENDSEYVSVVKPLLLARLGQDIDPSETIEAFGLPPEAANLFREWALRNVDFVVARRTRET